MFTKKRRNKNRKALSNILGTFREAKKDLLVFVKEKDGHIKRIQNEMAILNNQKAAAEQERKQASKVADNIDKLLAEKE